MYYLAKFCRICIKTGVKLLDINTVDFDYVTFSEKLEFCTKMVIVSKVLWHLCWPIDFFSRLSTEKVYQHKYVSNALKNYVCLMIFTICVNSPQKSFKDI